MGTLPTILQATKELIRQTLAQFHGDITKSAFSLGVSRATLYRYVQLYSINLADLRGSSLTKGAGNSTLN